MQKMKIYLVIALSLLTMSQLDYYQLVSAQSNDPISYDNWRLVGVESDQRAIIGELIAETYPEYAKKGDDSDSTELAGRIQTLSLSPSGDTIIAFVYYYDRTQDQYWNNVLILACVYSIDDRSVTCYPQPEASRSRAGNRVVWSPDSTRLIIYANFHEGYDSDLWLFDLADGEFTNLTDDSFDGWLTDAPETTVFLDVAPIWDSQGQNIYFFRKHLRLPIVELYRFATLTEELELITNISDVAPAFSLAETSFVSISPDDHHLAFILGYQTSGYEEFYDHIWKVDLETGDIQLLLDGSAFYSGLPDWYEEDMIVTAIEWLSDGVTLLALVSPPYDRDQFPTNFYNININTAEVQPLLDLSGIQEDKYDPEQFGQYPQLLFGLLTADNATLFYRFYVEPLMAAPTSFAKQPVELNGDYEILERLLARLFMRWGDQPLIKIAANGHILLGDELYVFQPQN